MCRVFWSLLLACSGLLPSVVWPAAASAEETAPRELTIYPSALKFSHTRQAQSVIAVWEQAGLVRGQLPESQLEWTVEPPGLARWEQGKLVPLQNGTGRLQVRAGESTADIPLAIDAYPDRETYSFRNDVQSVLTKFGCNSGACHGAAAGKNGFRLSLRGYDPEFDFAAITRQARGRRIVPNDPGRSLLLTKPTGAVPHKGGVLLDPASAEYQLLADWIAAGQQGPQPTDPRITQLRILPRQFRLEPGAQLQLIVQVEFSDGRTEDVTSLAKFTSHNESVASLADQGALTVQSAGEGAVLAWYLGLNEMVRVSVPLSESKAAVDSAPASVEFVNAAEETPVNLIDLHVQTKLRQLNIPSSPLCDDAEFLRRLYLDTLGILPTPEEVRAFLEQSEADKRRRAIAAVLERPEFVDYWAYRWSDLFLVTSQQLRPAAVKVYYAWIRQHVEQNTPWDRLVRELIVAKGSTLERGAANFYALHRDPLSLTENVSVAFLGMSLNCARCHDHPLEKWTNDDYYGMVSLFARVRGKGWGGEARGGDGNRVVFLAPEGEIIQPRTGKPQPPRPLDGAVLSDDPTLDRREILADWLTDPANPYFTKAIVNRVWANFLGVGLVESVDDLRLTNPPSNPELFEALAEFLHDQQFDLKQLMRLILESNTYQRSSQPLPENKQDQRYYSRYYPKRLSAEVLLDALAQVTDVPSVFNQTQLAGGGTEKQEFAVGTKALQLNDTSVVSYFLQTFGRPERLTTCECELSDEPSMSQVLHILNGTTLNDKLAQPDNALQQQLASAASTDALIEQAYLKCLARLPTADELAAIQPLLEATQTPAERREALEDVYWSLLSSNEFLFNR